MVYNVIIWYTSRWYRQVHYFFQSTLGDFYFIFLFNVHDRTCRTLLNWSGDGRFSVLSLILEEKLSGLSPWVWGWCVLSVSYLTFVMLKYIPCIVCWVFIMKEYWIWLNTFPELSKWYYDFYPSFVSLCWTILASQG
jgi:hypothetical protein